MNIEYRVSFTIWPYGAPVARSVERITDDVQSASEQMTNLQTMLAPHTLRPCDVHVWNPKMERRQKDDPPWEPIPAVSS